MTCEQLLTQLLQEMQAVKAELQKLNVSIGG